MRQYDHGGDIYRNAVRLDFSVNTSPLGMPRAVKQALIEGIDTCERYPDPYCEELCRAISSFEDVSPEHILCGNGAADIIYRLVLSQRPKRALICSPTFSEYERAVLLSGGEVQYHELYEWEDFAVTEQILRDITPDVDMLFLCNPNNPTGGLVDPGLLEEILQKCAACGVKLVVDECFLPFSEGSSIGLPPGVVILRAFTKLYSMAGLRLGFMMCSDRELLDAARNHAQIWSVSAPAQLAGIAALGCGGWIEKNRDTVKAERRYLEENLRQMDFCIFPGQANFFLIKSELPLYDRLLERGILVRSCGNFRGLDKRFIRIGVKTREKNEILIDAIREIKELDT